MTGTFRQKKVIEIQFIGTVAMVKNVMPKAATCKYIVESAIKLSNNNS